MASTSRPQWTNSKNVTARWDKKVQDIAQLEDYPLGATTANSYKAAPAPAAQLKF